MIFVYNSSFYNVQMNNFSFKFLFFFFQDLPGCCSSLGLSAIRSRLIDYGCWAFATTESNDNNTTNNCINNNNIIKGERSPEEKSGQPNLTPLHRFYKKQQKTMPGFRSRARLCGCLQVSFVIHFHDFYSFFAHP